MIAPGQPQLPPGHFHPATPPATPRYPVAVRWHGPCYRAGMDEALRLQLEAGIVATLSELARAEIDLVTGRPSPERLARLVGATRDAAMLALFALTETKECPDVD